MTGNALIEQKISAFAESRHANGQSHAKAVRIVFQASNQGGATVSRPQRLTAY
jgi:hypothetical protein